MKKNFEHKISRVLPESIAEELEIEPGDVLLAVNDQPIEDVFDYHYSLMIAINILHFAKSFFLTFWNTFIQ